MKERKKKIRRKKKEKKLGKRSKRVMKNIKRKCSWREGKEDRERDRGR